MSTYTRVVPRDLFNESKLLKCLGQLALIILDGCDSSNRACPKGLRYRISGRRFRIEQREEDGHLVVVSGIRFLVGDRHLSLYSHYNSKDAYPLRCETNDGDAVPVLAENGTLSDEFIWFVDKLRGENAA